ncbi:cyclophilin-like fold protein [Chryseobacterium sp. T20]|uniref:cyclophilin-like fold protein n=1 Tax=Chryseobacterium sp. T20 TaxID=3395375 RepID=UPI0039BC4738
MNKFFSVIPIVVVTAIISCSNTTTENKGILKPELSQLAKKEAPVIKISVDGKSYVFTLENNKTTEELLKTLPFEGSAGIYHDNHYYLPTTKAITTNGLKPVKEAKKGHLVYSAEYKGLGIFFADGTFADNELFYIGKTEDDVSAMSSNKTATIKVELLK